MNKYISLNDLFYVPHKRIKLLFNQLLIKVPLKSEGLGSFTMANIMDLHDKAMAIYDKAPKQSQHFREELSVILTNMVVEYNNLSDLLHITENEAIAVSDDHEALKHEFARLRLENEKLRQKLSSGLT